MPRIGFGLGVERIADHVSEPELLCHLAGLSPPPPAPRRPPSYARAISGPELRAFLSQGQRSSASLLRFRTTAQSPQRKSEVKQRLRLAPQISRPAPQPESCGAHLSRLLPAIHGAAPVPLRLIGQPGCVDRCPSQTAGRGHIRPQLRDGPPAPRHAGRHATRRGRQNHPYRRLQHGTPIAHRRCTLGRAARPRSWCEWPPFGTAGRPPRSGFALSHGGIEDHPSLINRP